MKWKCYLIIGLALSVSLMVRADAVWQWSAPIGKGRAFLWISPGCQQVRAVIVAQNNMLEEGILQHEYFRKQMAKLGIAEMFIAPPFDTWQNPTNNDATDEKFNALLKTLAGDSGYGELAFAPVIPIGHSALASYPWNFAAWNPDRTLAILSIHGDAPRTTLVGNGQPNVDWGGRNIDGIPGLMVMGEYEWWEDRLTPAVKFHAAHPATPVGVLCDVGHGHFDCSDELVRFLALFIRKSVEQRLPVKLSPGKPPVLKPVDPKNGWLVACWHKGKTGPLTAGPLAKFSGNPDDAFWCFDKEMAQASVNFNSKCGTLPQLAGFMQNSEFVPQTETHQQANLKFEPQADGVTFKLAGAFYAQVPGGSSRLTNWTGLPVGALLNHAANGGPVRISRITGPVAQLDADTFAVRFSRATVNVDRRMGDIWLLASHPGDAKYKSAVQQALLKIPAALKDGSEQHIAFPEISDQKAGVKSLRLAAVSDAGLPVYYYVREGPAEMDGDVLRFTEIPPRAKFPVKVTLVAWQYGRNVDPKIQSAMPVEREFSITR